MKSALRSGIFVNFALMWPNAQHIQLNSKFIWFMTLKDFSPLQWKGMVGPQSVIVECDGHMVVGQSWQTGPREDITSKGLHLVSTSVIQILLPKDLAAFWNSVLVSTWESTFKLWARGGHSHPNCNTMLGSMLNLSWPTNSLSLFLLHKARDFSLSCLMLTHTHTSLIHTH